MVGDAGATASAASITGPSWPAVSAVPRCQRVRRPSASCSCIAPAPENPGRAGGARVGRHAVDVVRSEPGIGDRAQAGLDGELEARAAETPPDCRHTDAGDDGAARPDGLMARPDGTPAPTRHPTARTGPRPACRCARLPPSQSMTLVVSRTSGSSAISTMAIDVGRRETGQPLVLVDGERGHRRPSRHRLGADIHAPASEARRGRRVEVPRARLAPMDHQSPCAPPVQNGSRLPRAVGQHPEVGLDVTGRHVIAPSILSWINSSSVWPRALTISSVCSANCGPRAISNGVSSNCTGLDTSSRSCPSLSVTARM